MLFSRSVVSDSLWPHGLQHARLPCPSPSPRACSNSCPWSRWCHPTISSSAAPFSSCLQSFPASGSFLMSQLFASSGQSIGASASVLPMNIQDWFPLGLTVLFKLTISPNYLTSITVSLEQFEKFSCSRNCEHFLSPHHALQLSCNPEENSPKPFFLAEAICMYFSFRQAQSEKAIRVSATYHLEHVFIKLLRIAEENLLKVKCK